VAYRRFFADGVALGKFEVGFDVRPIGGTTGPFSVADAVEGLLNLSIQVSGSALRNLGGAGAALAGAYTKATTPHDTDPAAAERFVIAGRPTVVVEHNGRIPWIQNAAKTLPKTEPDAPHVNFWHHRQFQIDIPVWLLPRVRNARNGSNRDLRLYICRFHAETEVIAKTLRSIAIGIVAPAARSPQSDRLQRFILDAFRHQRQLGVKLDQKASLPFYEQALWYRDHALPGYYDGLLARISAINPRPAVQTVIEAYLADRQRQDDRATVFVVGDYVVTQSNVENSGVIGVMGVANNSTIIGGQTAPGGGSNEAVAELETLASILKERAVTPDEEVGAEAVAKAAEKLAKGDAPSALAWLKRSGAWALKVAEDVSVKLAAELIIRAST
jgi:hypothetical protein